MKLDRIVIKGFKSIKTLDLNLSNLNVLIGANGAGKSNFISLFRLFNDIIEGRLQESVGIAGGAEALLFFGHKATEKISIDLHFGPNRYYSEFVPTEDDTLIFKTEEIYQEIRNLTFPQRLRKDQERLPHIYWEPYKIGRFIISTIQAKVPVLRNGDL